MKNRDGNRYILEKYSDNKNYSLTWFEFLLLIFTINISAMIGSAMICIIFIKFI